MCKDVYHCRPSELATERMVDVLRDLNCRTVEGEHADMERRAAERDARG